MQRGHQVQPFWIDSRYEYALSALLNRNLDAKTFRRESRVAVPHYFHRISNVRPTSGRADLVDYAEQAARLGLDKAGKRTKKKRLRRQPKPRRLLIHVGQPKTGTSAAQAHFFHASQHYAQKGLWYPTQRISRADLNHAWISQSLRDENTTQLRETLAAAPKNCTTVLLSDESLYVDLPGISEAARQALTDAVQGWDVEVILFRRDVQEWKRSFYIQSIQNRRGGSKLDRPSARDLWQTHLKGAQFFELPFVRQLLDFDAMSSELSRILGARQTHLLHYAKSRDTIDTICAAIGLDRAPDTGASRRNLSLKDTDAEILRQANGIHNQDAWFIRGLIEDKFGIASEHLHKRRATRAVEVADGFDWTRFAFAPNPPLLLDELEFERRVTELQDKSGKLLSQIRLLS